MVFGYDGGVHMKHAQPHAMRSHAALAAIDASLAARAGDPDADPDAGAALAMSRLEHAWVESAYPRFNPWTYSLDTFLPIVDLHHESYWTPKEGWRRWFYQPFHILMGWVVVTLFVVSFTGLMRRSGDD